MTWTSSFRAAAPYVRDHRQETHIDIILFLRAVVETIAEGYEHADFDV